MDLGTVIVTIVMIAICILPFSLMSIKNSKKRKENTFGLLNIAKLHNCHVEQSEFWSDSVIALDKINRKIFFSNRASDREAYKVISLAEVRQCTWIKTDNNNNGIRNLELQLVFDGGRPNVMLEFYNEYQNLTLVNEFELIKKWCGIIESHIKK